VVDPALDTKKSMTGRSNLRVTWGLRVARTLLNTAERVSPRAAARALAWLMFRTQRSTPPAREKEWLAGGDRWELPGPLGKLVAFRFGRGPVVILVHGWNGRGAQLGEFIAPLVAAGFGVTTFDAPGHGLSSGSQASLVAFADAYDRVVNALRESGEEVRGVIAHSLGAAAVTFAESRRVRSNSGATGGETRLVFVAPPIDVREWVREFTSTFGASRNTEHALSGLVQDRVGYRFADLYAPDLARDMRAPLLVLHDEHDRAVPVRSGAALAEAWPDAKLVTSSGLGHMRILRDKDTIRRAVAFIRGDSFPAELGEARPAHALA
jgi:pimeloyl-ACP methyl ester carboxylesterase